MKYNENTLKSLFENESTIWSSDDLDWFDEQLVHKLQNNQLASDEKQKIITMMANDQTIMHRYLKLKQATAPLKNSKIGTIRPFLVPLFSMAVAITFVFIFVFKSNDIEEFDLETTRGVGNTKIYPENSSHLKSAPEFFIIKNQQNKDYKITLKAKETIIWESEFQKSNKFYIPVEIYNKLHQGHYNWIIQSHNKTKNSKPYTFSID
jgi:hypothetical protein